MKYSIYFTTVLITLALIAQPAIATTCDWLTPISAIQPGISNRDDVENLFNDLKVVNFQELERSITVSYKTAHGQLTVSYANSLCSENKTEPNFATVNYLLFIASKGLDRDMLKINFQDFQRTEEDDTENVIYLNAERGLRYVLSKDQTLTEVMIYTPKARSLCSGL